MRNRKLHETERYQLQDEEKHLRVSRVRERWRFMVIAVVFDRYYWKEQIDESMEEEKRIVN